MGLCLYVRYRWSTIILVYVTGRLKQTKTSKLNIYIFIFYWDFFIFPRNHSDALMRAGKKLENKTMKHILFVLTKLLFFALFGFEK